ncbi:hypothetical protein E4U60_007743 [Claviceps pazoutovae]|uniref:Cytochrome P450 n=1 Tax=Claviceps pazoutovae TaxID=1649127 RepID=A0A9P7MEF0_9HYPO|nr:hypothetical protein E4U60_007743 [Claviceps pazoutovae]
MWTVGTLVSGIVALGLCLLINQSIRMIRVAFDAQLVQIPGPIISRFTSLILKINTLRGQRTRYIHSLHQQYGPFVRVAPREVSISDLDSVRQIHRIGTPFRKSAWYKEVTRQPLDDQCTVFAIQDPRKASARRKLFQRSATHAAVQQWEPVVAQLANLTVQKIKKDVSATGTADVAKWWSMMAADVLTSLAFGKSYRIVETGQRPALITDLEAIPFLSTLQLEIPWIWPLMMSRLPLPGLGTPAVIFGRNKEYGSIAVRNAKESSQRGIKTLFSEMLPQEDKQEQPLSDKVIALESINLLFAGVDTTATALTYLVYAVLREDAIKQELVHELASCSYDASWDELEQLPFLHGVIQETLRLYPPVPATLKREVPPEGALLGGYMMPAGITVGAQAYTLHRDPAIWDNPERQVPTYLPTPKLPPPSLLLLGRFLLLSPVILLCSFLCLKPQVTRVKGAVHALTNAIQQI